MRLKVPIDQRQTPQAIAGELVVVPSVSPYITGLIEVPATTGGVVITRISDAVMVGVGTGGIETSGVYTGMTNRSYRVEIDTAGDIEVGGATFKWSHDGGSTWEGLLIPIEDTDPYVLELGVAIVASNEGFRLGDYWTFTAESWVEVSAVPMSSEEFQVDYDTGKILFVTADAGKTVKAAYNGMGSLVQSSDIEQLVDVLNAGVPVVRNLDTSDFYVGDAVYIDNDGVVQLAWGRSPGLPATGFVRVVGTDDGEVILLGPMTGLGGTLSAKYYLATTWDAPVYGSNGRSICADGDGFVYVGTTISGIGTGSVIHKMVASSGEVIYPLWVDESGVNVIGLVSDENYIYAALGEYDPPRVVKISKATMTTVSTWTPASYGSLLLSQLIYHEGSLFVGMAQFAAVSKIYKVDPSTMVTTSSASIGTSSLCIVSMTAGGIYIYAGMKDYGHVSDVVLKIDTETLAVTDTWTAESEPEIVGSLAYYSGSLFIGISADFSKVTKVDITTMETIATWLSDTYVEMYSLIYADGFVFAGTNPTIVKLNPATMAEVAHDDGSYLGVTHVLLATAYDGQFIYVNLDSGVRKIRPLSCQSGDGLIVKSVDSWAIPGSALRASVGRSSSGDIKQVVGVASGANLFNVCISADYQIFDFDTYAWVDDAELIT